MTNFSHLSFGIDTVVGITNIRVKPFPVPILEHQLDFLYIGANGIIIINNNINVGLSEGSSHQSLLFISWSRSLVSKALSSSKSTALNNKRKGSAKFLVLRVPKMRNNESYPEDSRGRIWKQDDRESKIPSWKVVGSNLGLAEFFYPGLPIKYYLYCCPMCQYYIYMRGMLY